MKAFEEWWKCNKNLPPYNMIPKCYIKEGFKAALKWVLNDCKGSHYNTLNELEYFIKTNKIENMLKED